MKRPWRLAGLAAAACLAAGACTPVPPSTPLGIGTIAHVVVIMQKNRSFDSYFGTYPRRRHPDAWRRAERVPARPTDARL